MLTLGEQLLLLGLKDEKGSVVFSASTALPYGLAGSILLDLYLLGKIEFDQNQIKIIDSSPTNNNLFDETILLIQDSKKLKDTKYWVNRITNKVKKINHRIADQLIAKNILKKEEHKILWIINYNRYPTNNEIPEKNIHQQIRAIVLNQKEPTEKEIALISLMKACELTNEVFGKGERKEAKKNIKLLTAQNKVGDAITKTVEEIMAAVMIVIITSSAASAANS